MHKNQIEHPAFTTAVAAEDLENRATLMSDKDHSALLSYIKQRLDDEREHRARRLERMARIDKSISTWQLRNREESERLHLEEAVGRVQGINSILPLLSTNLEDTAAFFVEIFTPDSRHIFTVPDASEDPQSERSMKELAKRMNRDFAFSGAHASVSRIIRSLLKYNIGGMRVAWNDATDASLASNELIPLDMYNVSWDPNVRDTTQIAAKAEWLAVYESWNRVSLFRAARQNGWDRERLVRALTADSVEGSADARTAEPRLQRSYVEAWRQANISENGLDTKSNADSPGAAGANLDPYFNTDGAEGTSAVLRDGLHELTRVYIWLDAAQFGFQAESERAYTLYEILILNGYQIVSAEVVQGESENEPDPLIPAVISPYTCDELGLAQRSPMELMLAFQRFASFLLAVWSELARKRVYGVSVYDSDVIDPDAIASGAVYGWIPAKARGRSLQNAVWTMNDSGNSVALDNVMQMILQVLQLSQTFFPSQMLPAQIAGIDRAVTRQVSAVLNTGQARLRYQARFLDTCLLGVVRKLCARNHMTRAAEGLTGLTDEQVSVILGSGMKSLNAERIENLMQQVLQATATSEQLASNVDLVKMLDTMTASMNLGFSFTDFMAQQGPGQTPEEVAAALAEQSQTQPTE